MNVHHGHGLPDSDRVGYFNVERWGGSEGWEWGGGGAERESS